MTLRRDSGYNTFRSAVLDTSDSPLTLATAIDADAFLALVSGRARGWRPTLLRAALRAVSLPYGGGVLLRNLLYQRGWWEVVRAAVPVVSVGNLTLGGTGKTPCVEYVARFFCQQERRVAILSRGYGSEQGPNDEALVLEENLPDVPHLQGTDRAALALTAVEELESEVAGPRRRLSASPPGPRSRPGPGGRHPALGPWTPVPARPAPRAAREPAAGGR